MNHIILSSTVYYNVISVISSKSDYIQDNRLKRGPRHLLPENDTEYKGKQNKKWFSFILKKNNQCGNAA